VKKYQQGTHSRLLLSYVPPVIRGACVPTVVFCSSQGWTYIDDYRSLYKFMFYSAQKNTI
jgi:hypothetical protein